MIPAFIDHIARKELPDGRYLQVYPLLFGRARLGIGTVPDIYDDVY